ncbi:MAG TPA: hypothetical protein VFG68_05375, partial [Fimbriiglobus sp.]|nr:hypothetical protein [Fimbriiglobus sp.]
MNEPDSTLTHDVLPSPGDSSPPHPLTPSPPHVLHEDYHLIAVNKPAPLLTQAPPTVPSLEAMV